ncbi:hypothetical protein GCM10020220_112790 [Nonomuraea rubra]
MRRLTAASWSTQADDHGILTMQPVSTLEKPASLPPMLSVTRLAAAVTRVIWGGWPYWPDRSWRVVAPLQA